MDDFADVYNFTQWDITNDCYHPVPEGQVMRSIGWIQKNKCVAIEETKMTVLLSEIDEEGRYIPKIRATSR